uniref:Uncharacterized protein LOC111135568 isoform X3 n=1 Tax=Crassostrea virginica TaxID=6565 RepID=A0A8B8ENG3_CRAVI|nr:uncharacterized protein LOC111135568 isoform X3 [Crassostrea virginica]
MKQQILALIFLVLISGTLGQTQGGDCPGGYFQVSRTACFVHSQCPDRSFCWFTPTRNHGICCPMFMEDKKEEIIKCLEKAAELLKGPGSSHTEAAVAPPNFRYSHLPVNLNHRNQQSVRNLFRPYSNGGRNVISYWSHKFLCLWSKDSDTVPSKEEKKLLFEAGLGEKKITFVKNNTSEDFTKKLEENYPKMKGCGGYELLRTATSSRIELKLIRPGSNGYTSEYLSNSYLGQATCFIRPIQIDLDISPVGEEHIGRKERCLECGEDVPLLHLRNHLLKCKGTKENDADHDDSDDNSLPTIQKRKVPKRSHLLSTNRPICEYACASKPRQRNMPNMQRIITNRHFTTACCCMW